MLDACVFLIFIISRHLPKIKTCIFMSVHVQPQCSHCCVSPQACSREKTEDSTLIVNGKEPCYSKSHWALKDNFRKKDAKQARLESGRANINQTNLSVLQESPSRLEVRLPSPLSLGKSCSQKPALITLLAHGSYSAASQNGDLWSWSHYNNSLLSVSK